ncbi:MAG: DUF5131 family protein, partial [Thermomicrobiales bacterium]
EEAMPGDTKIEWADATWNPVTGCTKASTGCDHCYAEAFAERFRGVPGHPYEQGFDLKLWPERLEIPLRWTKPRRIFVNSMSDLFHPGVPDFFIAKVFAVMAMADQHTFLILTKRPRRMAKLMSSPEFWSDIAHACLELALPWPAEVWPLPNVWLGTSVENQEAAFRGDYLARTPAAVRFLSCEPLLGPLELWKWLLPDSGSPAVDWVIGGGESGRGFRPVEADWVRGLRDQCVLARVPFFFKQWGGFRSKSEGRELDGRTWDEFPEVVG